jgi:hypothetical protein
MTMLATTLYDEALRGEPVEQAVHPALINTRSPFWSVGDWVIVLPVPELHRAPSMQRAVRELRQWTGWSARRVAEVLGTSHTTIRALEGGRSLVEGHSGNLRRRLTDAHDVAERVLVLADRDPERAGMVLGSAPPGRRSAAEELRAGDPGRAYLAAIDVLRPPRQGLVVGGRPRRSGATTALHE